jgi:uroporphyrinogen decarboxylase
MNKRDLILNLPKSGQPAPYVPAAFFLHFPPAFHEGRAAVEKHIEFFRHTGMDLVKIQYEGRFPQIPEIQHPDDWSRMPVYARDFFAGQLAAVEGLVQALKAEAVVVVTLYSPFMCAGHSTSDALLTQHLRQDPKKVRPGLEAVTESLLLFARECIKLGVDGFYHSTQGGEAGRFDDSDIFREYIKPYDLALMQEVNQNSAFNILHVCDYQRDYNDFSPFLEYPGDVVNSPLKLGGRTLTPVEVAQMFNRPYMGGMERKGVIASGTPEQIKAAALDVLRAAPEHFILAADCTVPNDTPWDNLKAAIDAAHAHRRSGS